MKILTAQEARALSRADENEVDAVLRAICEKIKQRAANAQTSALIGLDPGTFAFARLPDPDRETVEQALRDAGYEVQRDDNNLKVIRIYWKNERKD